MTNFQIARTFISGAKELCGNMLLQMQSQLGNKYQVSHWFEDLNGYHQW